MKKVKFDKITEIYYYIQSYNKQDFYYWIRVKMDHERFQERINKMHYILNPILIKHLYNVQMK